MSYFKSYFIFQLSLLFSACRHFLEIYFALSYLFHILDSLRYFDYFIVQLQLSSQSSFISGVALPG